jgi:hypothetical protein
MGKSILDKKKMLDKINVYILIIHKAFEKNSNKFKLFPT